jgi:hypothetical protein
VDLRYIIEYRTLNGIWGKISDKKFGYNVDNQKATPNNKTEYKIR